MENKLTNSDVMSFLGNVERTSSVEILSEGSKEKNDLINSAKKRGILAEGSRDLGLLKTIFLYTDLPNSNGAIIPSKEFRKIFPQIIGKPMNVSHNRRNIVGFYTDYRYIQKENKAITYAVFFKSNFPDLWEKAKKFQKKGKLASSFEIWSKDKKVVSEKDQTYSLNSMELAGGALIFEEYGEEPAFKNAKILALAKKDLAELVDNKCLCFASKYKNGKIICANGECEEMEFAETFNCECIICHYKMSSEKHCIELKCPKCSGQMRRAERPGAGQPTSQGKIKCSNCGEELEYNGIDVQVKCSRCFALLNKEGVMQYPPQIKDFKMLCPSCKIGNWLIMSKTETGAKLRCLNCAKEYKITFDKAKPNEIMNKLQFVYCGSINCYQCGRSIDYSGVSTIKERTFKCPKCGLEFSYNIIEGERYKKISKIEEIKKEKTSDKEETKMDKKDEKVSEEKVEEKKIEETKVEKVEEQPKVEETLKAEKKVEAKEEKVEEPKVEEKTEAKVEKAEEQPEAKAKEVKAEEAPKVEEPKEEAKTEKVEDKPIEEKIEVKPEVEVKVEKAEETKVEVPVEKKVEEVKVEEIKTEVKPNEAEVKEEKVEVKEEAKVEETKVKLAEAKKMVKALEKNIEKLNEALKKVKENAEKEIAFYKANALEINKRREDLGETELSDKDILDDTKFAKAKADKENASIEKAEVVGDKFKTDDYYAKKRQEIDDLAFGRVKGTTN